MADYPFRVNMMPKNGEGTIAFYTSSLVTDAEALVSASIMVEKLNLMPSASYEDGVVTGSSTAFAHKFGGNRNLHLSCSVSDPNAGTITFHDKEVDTDGGLDYYTFWGTKVCSVLGLPEGIPIFTENFKLSDSSTDPDNYLSGQVISDAVSIKSNFKLSPQARVRSNLVWDEEFGEGLVQWASGSSTQLRMGYDNVSDTYSIRGNGFTQMLGFGEIGNATNAITSGSFVRLDAIDIDMKAGGSKLTIGETNAAVITIGDGFGVTGAAPATGKGNIAGVFIGSQNTVKMTAGPGDGSDAIVSVTTTGLHVEHTQTDTFDNEATTSDFQLILRNNTDTSEAFVGIAFQAEAGFNADRINAAIFAEREDAGASDVNSDLVFATNNDADDDLFERMRIDTNGNVGIGTDSPGEMLHLASSATAEPIIKIENTNTDATAGSIQFVKNGHGEADNDVLGSIDFKGDDSGNVETLYAQIIGRSGDITNASEDGDIAFKVAQAGTMRTVMHMDGASEDVLVHNDLYVTGAEPTNGAIGTHYFRIHNNNSANYIDFGGGSTFFRDDGSTTIMTFENGTFDVGIGTTSPTARLDVRDNPSTTYVGQFRNTTSTDSGDSYILNLWHSQEDSTADFDTSEHWVQFSDNSGTTLGEITNQVTYTTFTGGHVSQIISGSATDNENELKDWKPGMILKSTGKLNVTGSTLDLAWPEVTITTTEKDKAVAGVYNDIKPGSGSNWVGVYNRRNAVSSSTGDWGKGHNMHGLDAIKPAVDYNALGEGMLLVTDTNGNIETGDYICSSDRRGHGQKQDDDLLHNYTVAKATQPIDFSTKSDDSDLGYKSVLVACTYHCG